MPGDLLEIKIQGKNMTITRADSGEKIALDIDNDIYSKTLREEELILAK